MKKNELIEKFHDLKERERIAKIAVMTVMTELVVNYGVTPEELGEESVRDEY